MYEPIGGAAEYGASDPLRILRDYPQRVNPDVRCRKSEIRFQV